MSDPKACPSVASRADFNGELQCSHGHPLIHKVYYDEAQAKIATLEGLIAQKDVILGAKLVAVTPDEGETLNHLRVEQSHGHIQLTLRGKSKMFTPKAIADLIRILKRSYNAANSYSPPMMIHCTNGIENP